MQPIILSLFDTTGSWSLPYKEAGYRVIQVDIKDGIDILSWDYKAIPKELVAGILAAPPCTDFSVSGAQYWPAKDADGTTAYAVLLVKKTIEIIQYFEPKFFAIENPVGRISKLVPELGKPWYFQPWEFGDPWTKKTGIWGSFSIPQKDQVDPVSFAGQGSWSQLLGGKTAWTKHIRSVTPPAFARAFFRANDPAGLHKEKEELRQFGRCKYGMWSCHFAVCPDICKGCEDGDSYEPDEYAMDFDTEEEMMMDIFDGGQGILRNIKPVKIFDQQ